MATIKGLTLEIGGNVTPLNKALGEVNSTSRDLQKELREVERLLKLDPHNTELVAQKQKILAESVSNTKDKLDTLKEAERQAQEQFKKGDITEEQYRAIQREVTKTEQELKKLEGKIKDTNNQWKESAKAMEDFGNKATDVGKTMTKKVTLPLMLMGAAAVKTGMDFEQSMSKVQAMSGATEDDMIRLEKAARDAGASTSKSAGDAADALTYMALAGWDVNTSIEGLMPVLRLSEAGQIDLATASSLVTDSMSAMGIEVDQLENYLDIVTQTARNSNTDIDQMAAAYLGVGGVLRGLGIPLEESAVSLGMMANAGIKGSESGTKLNKILLNLTAPVGRAKEAMDKLNLTAFNMDGSFKGLDNILFELKDKTQDLTTEQQNMYLSMIAGSANIDGMNALMNGLDDSYDSLKDSVMSADGALNEVAKTMQDNAKGKLIQLGSALQEAGLKIYDVLEPAITWLIEALQKLVSWFDELDPTIQIIIVVVGVLVAAIGPLLLVIGFMATGISAVMGAMVALTPVVTALGAVFTLLSGPVGIIIAIVAALALGISHLWKTNEGFRDAVTGIWTKIKNGMTTAIDAIMGPISFLIEKTKSAIEWLKSLAFWNNNSDTKKSKAPSGMAEGGSITSGSSFVGERGVELLTVTQGVAKVTPLGRGGTGDLASDIANAITNSMAMTQDNNGQINLTINLGTDKLADKIIDLNESALRNRGSLKMATVEV